MVNMVYKFECEIDLTDEEKKELREQAETTDDFGEYQAVVGWYDWMYRFCDVDEDATTEELESYELSDVDSDRINAVLKFFFDEAEKKRMEEFEKKYN